MPNVSAAPGLPQSSASTVNGSVVVPVDRMTAAVPLNLACLLPGVLGHELPGLLMTSVAIDCALIRTSIGWSSYSRLPLAAQHFTVKPNEACALGSATLGSSAGTEMRSPVAEKTGSPWI